MRVREHNDWSEGIAKSQVHGQAEGLHATIGHDLRQLVMIEAVGLIDITACKCLPWNLQAEGEPATNTIAF